MTAGIHAYYYYRRITIHMAQALVARKGAAARHLGPVAAAPLNSPARRPMQWPARSRGHMPPASPPARAPWAGPGPRPAGRQIGGQQEGRVGTAPARAKRGRSAAQRSSGGRTRRHLGVPWSAPATRSPAAPDRPKWAGERTCLQRRAGQRSRKLVRRPPTRRHLQPRAQLKTGCFGRCRPSSALKLAPATPRAA